MPDAQAIDQGADYQADDHSMADLVAPAGGAPAEPLAPAGGDWKQSFGGDPSLDRFNSPDEFMKSFNEAQGFIRQSIRIPTQDAGEQQMNDFYGKLEKIPGVYRTPNPDDKASVDAFNAMRGVPASADGYNLTDIQGFTQNQDDAQGFKQMALDMQLTPQQAEQLHQVLGSGKVNMDTQSRESVEAGINGLRQEWGAAFEQNHRSALGSVGFMSNNIDGFQEWIDGGAGNDPMVIRLMAKIAELGGEAQAYAPPNSAGAMTPADAEAAISDIRNNPAHPYNNDGDPAHSSAVEKMTELYKFVRR